MPVLELRELREHRALKSSELQARADQNPWSQYRLQFVAIDQGKEVAFLSFDLVPDQDHLVLYELYVTESRRGCGLGSALVERAAQITRDRGKNVLLVRPHPLAPGVSQEWLERWYAARGFAPWPKDEAILAKVVSEPLT